MSKKNIKIIQHILKEQNRYDLSIKLENSYYEEYLIDSFNNLGEIRLFIHPNNFLFFKNELSNEDKNLLIELLNGFSHNYSKIDSLLFAINSNIDIEDLTDTTYIFVDEAGDMDFSKNGTKYYMFSFLVKKRPFKLHEYISNYRYSLLESNLNRLNSFKVDIEAFHASYDNKYVRDELFNIIETFEQNAIKVYSYILEKPKVEPLKREDKDRFYIENLKYSIKRLLNKLNIDTNFIIITDRLPLKQDKKKQIKALKEGIKSFIVEKNLDIRYDIFHHCNASSINLQIVDYISWAIFRKYEREDLKYYNKIRKYILDEDVMTKHRKQNHYEV